MPSLLPAAVNVGQFNACVVRVAKLAADCSPLGGNSSGWVTGGLVTMTATPDVEEGTVFEPKTACGDIAYTIEDEDKIKRYNLTGEFIFFDVEGSEIMFGGSTVVGASGGDYDGDNIGYAVPDYNSADTNGVYLEIITKASGEGAGDCVSAVGGFPTYHGHMFGKVKMTPGERTFENDVARLAFTGKARSNPALFDGPWNDFPGLGYIPTSPYVTIGYTDAEYATILASVAPGYADLPAAS
jgi:hypothetical protein